MICWSRRSRSSRNNLSASGADQSDAGDDVRTPPFSDEISANGSTLSPVFVRTISMETWTRSSAGARATSRTRPHCAPEASSTGEPSSSVSAIVLILPECPLEERSVNAKSYLVT